MRGKVYLFAPFALALLALLSLVTIGNIGQDSNSTGNGSDLRYPTASVAPAFLNLSDLGLLQNLSGFNLTLQNLTDLNLTYCLIQNTSGINFSLCNESYVSGLIFSLMDNQADGNGADSSKGSSTNQSDILNQTDQTNSNSTISSNNTSGNQTEFNETVYNQTDLNLTETNQTILNESGLNQTFTNQTIYNSTEANQTQLNLTSNQSDSNFTNASADLEFGILEEKLKKFNKLTLKKLGKRIREANGTNETVFDLDLAVGSKKKKPFSNDLSEALISIKGIRNLGDLNGIQTDAPQRVIHISRTSTYDEVATLTTDFVGFDALQFDEAVISLPEYSKTDQIVVCDSYDAVNNICSHWSVSDTQFDEQGGVVTFKTNHFSGYAGANITILNVQSYPVVGGDWIVRFTTTGAAPLTVTAIDNTSFGTDLQFKSINCGDADAGASFNGNAAYVANYSCDLEGTETSGVLTEGKHHLMFQFGDAVAYANNTASLFTWYLQNAVFTGSYKIMNTTAPPGTPTTYNDYLPDTLGCFATQWYTPTFNKSSAEQAGTYVNGTFNGSITLRNEFSGASGSWILNVSILKYNQSGSSIPIGTTSLAAKDCGPASITTQTYNLTLNSSSDTTLLRGERLGVQFCVQSKCTGVQGYRIYYNRTDSWLNFTNETVAMCDSLTSSLTMDSNVTVPGSCFNVIANNIVLNCNGYSVIGSGTGTGINVSNYGNVTIKNCNFRNFSTGIYAKQSNNLTVFNTSILTSANLNSANVYGILVSGSSLANFTGVSLNSTNATVGIWGTYGISLSNVSNATINNVSFDNFSIGMYLSGYSNNTLVINSRFSRIETYGINGNTGYFLNATNNVFSLNGPSGQGIGIYPTATFYNFSASKNNFTNLFDGIDLGNGMSTGITLNRFDNISAIGINFAGCTSCNVSSNTFINSVNAIEGLSHELAGYYFRNNYIGFNTFENNTGYGIRLSSGTIYNQYNQIANNIFRNNTVGVVTFTTSAADALYITGNNFTNNTFYPAQGKMDVNLTNSYSNNFINNSFNRSTVTTSNANYTMMFFINVLATTADGTPLAGAQINITNSTSGATNYINLSTDSNGNTGFMTVLEFAGNSTRNSTYTYYNFSGGYLGVYNSTLVPVNTSKTVTLVIPATICGTLTSSVTMQNDINATGDCLLIGSPNIVVDCNGHTITGSGTGSGILNDAPYNNFTIRNCNIRQFTNGINHALAVSNFTLAASNFTNNTYGLYASSGFGDPLNTLNITGNRFFSNARGVLIDSFGAVPVYNVNITNNLFENNSIYGLRFKTSLGVDFTNNTVIGNIFSNNTSTGLVLESVSGGSSSMFGNLIANNTFISYGTSNEINLTYSYNNLFLNNSFNRSKVAFVNANYTIQNYVRINVTNIFYVPISGALVNMTNGTAGSTNYFGLITDVNGLTAYKNVTVFNGNTTANTTYDVYNISGSYSGRSNSSLTNVSNGGTFLLVLPIAQCITINSSFTLPSNVSSNSSCISIGASNITLNCAGYSITGNKNGSGIYVSGKTNVSIKNCFVYNFTDGILLTNGSSLANLSGNILVNNSDAGIYANGSSTNLTITNNTFIDNENFSMFIDSGWFSTISLNNISSQFVMNRSYLRNSTGFYFLNFSFGQVISNTLNRIFAAAGSAGIFFGGIPVSGQAGSSAFGMRLNNSNNNTFSNNTIQIVIGGPGGNGYDDVPNTDWGSNGGAGGSAFGFYLFNSFNNSFINSTIANVTAGIGGNGGYSISGSGGNGGTGGFAFGFHADQSGGSLFQNFLITNVTAAAGGAFGSGIPAGAGGPGGSAFGMRFVNSNLTTLSNSSVIRITGKNGGAGGTRGGNATLMEFYNSNNFTLRNGVLNISYSGSGNGVGGPGGHAFGLVIIGNNTVVNSTVISQVEAINGGSPPGNASTVQFSNANNNQIFDSTLDYPVFGTSKWSINSLSNSRNNLAQNITWGTRALAYSGGINNLTVRNTLNVTVLTISGGAYVAVSGASVNITNATSSTSQYNGTTDSQGQIPVQIVTEFAGNDTANVSYTPYNITATKSPYFPSSQNYSITSNTQVTIILSSCGTLTSNYNQPSDINAYGSCFAIGSNNLNINCNGYSIVGNRSSNSIGLLGNGYSNITISNCRIYNFTNAVYLNNSLNITLNNVTFFNNTQANLVLDNSSSVNVTNSNFSNMSIGWGDVLFNRNSANNLFINTSFNRSGVNFSTGNNNFSVLWYLNVNVKDQQNNNVQGAQVTIRNSTGDLVAAQTTDSNGDIPVQLLPEYYQNGSSSYAAGCLGSGANISCATPYNVSAVYTLGGRSGTAYSNVTLNISKTVGLNVNFAPVISLTSPADGSWTRNATVNFTFVPSDDGGFSNCTLWAYDNDNSLGPYLTNNQSAIANSSINAISYAVPNDANYSWNVYCYDNGNPSRTNSSANWSVKVDTAAPANISVSPPTLGNSSYSSSTWVFVNFTFTELNPDTCFIRWNNGTDLNVSGTRIGSGGNYSCSLNLTNQPEGNWNYTLYVNDSAGNIASNGTFYIVLDRTPASGIQPVSPTLANNSFTNKNWVYANFTFAEQNPNYCLLEFNNGTAANMTMSRTGNNCYLNLTNQPDGYWNYSIYVVDLANNTGSNGVYYVNIDTLPPSQIQTINPTLPNNTFTNKNWVFINSTFVELNPYNCLLQWNNGTAANITMSRSGTNCYFNLTNQPDGYWNYSIIANDSAGNLASNGTFGINIDTVPPAVPQLVQPSPSNNSKIYVNWTFINATFTETNPDTCLLQWNNGTAANITMTRSGNNCYINMTQQPLGPANFTVIVNDSAGWSNSNGTFFLQFWAPTILNYVQHPQIYDRNGHVNITVMFSRPDLGVNFTDYSAGDYASGNGTNVSINPLNMSVAFSDSPANTSYYPSAMFDKVLDSGFANAHWTVSWNATILQNTNITVQAAVSVDNATYSAFQTLANSGGSAVNNTPARYLKYRIVFTTNTTVTPYLNSINSSAVFGLPGNVTINLTKVGFPVSIKKSCSTFAAGNCTINFGFPSDVPGGNYSVNITAHNTSQYYEYSSLLYYYYFEEAATKGSLAAPSIQLAAGTYRLIQVNLSNTANASMIRPYVYFNGSDSAPPMAATFNSSTCNTTVAPNASCYGIWNLTVPPSISPGFYSAYWRANWTNNNGSITTQPSTTQPYISSVEVLGNPDFSTDTNLVNLTTSLSQQQVVPITLTNTGNVKMYNLSAYFISNSLPPSWITWDFFPNSPEWPINGFRTLTVYVTVPAPYTPGTYTGVLNVTADYPSAGTVAVSRPINISVFVNPQASVTPTAISANQNLSANPAYSVTVNNTGNAPLTNVTVSLVNSTIPNGWISFNSSDANWDAVSNRWTQILESTSVVLDVLVSVLDFLKGIFTALIKITSNEGITSYVNITIDVNPQLTAVDQIVLMTAHGATNVTSFSLNSTGNIKLVNVSITYQPGTLNSSWVSLGPTFFGNITEGTNASVSLNVSVPIGTLPGNYSGILNISGYNANKTINLTVIVPLDTSWNFTPTSNQSASFKLNLLGNVGNLTIFNNGNIDLNFSLAYMTPGGYPACSGSCFPQNYNATHNPWSLFVPRASNRTIILYHDGGGASNINPGYAKQIDISNDTATPVSSTTFVFFNITNDPPVVVFNGTFVNASLQNYVEFNRTISLNATATDDDVNGLNASTAYFNVSRPDGVNESFLATYKLVDPFTICGLSCTDAGNFSYAYNNTNVSGTYYVSFQIRDTIGQLNTSSFSFTVIPTTVLTVNGTNTTVANASKTQNKTLLLNITTNNTGFVNAYLVNLTGTFAKSANASDTLANWSYSPVGTIPSINATRNNVTAFSITVPPRSLGVYYFTVSATYLQPNGTVSTVWGPNVSIDVLQNPDFYLNASNQSFAMAHGSSRSEWFTITPSGNTNLTAYNVSVQLAGSNYSVQLNSTNGSLDLDSIANITMNISVIFGALSGQRSYLINVTSGNISRTFNTTFTVPYNNTWAASPSSYTIDGIANENHIDYTTLVTHLGTGDAYLNFTFNLTGNMSAFTSLVSNSALLNATQNYSVGLNYTVPDATARYAGYLNITEYNSSSSSLVNITFRSFTVELQVINITAPSQVIAGDIINETVLLIFGSENTTANTTWKMFLNGTECPLLENHTVGNETHISCTAPSITDAKYYDLAVRANYSTGTSSLVKNTTNSSAIFYKDVTPPQIVWEQSNDTLVGMNTTLVLNATDNLQLANATVLVTFPNSSTLLLQIPFNSTTSLYQIAYNFTPLGLYLANYSVNDTTGNPNNSIMGSFEVYTMRAFFGSILNLESNPIFINFTVKNTTTGNLDSFATNGSGYFNKTLRSQFYDLNLKFLMYDINISGVDFTTINQSILSIDNFSGSDISAQILGAKAGFAVISEMNYSASMKIDYTSLLGSITDESLLRVYSCYNYTYNTRTCAGTWNQLPNSTVNSIQNYILANSSNFANTTVAYALVQYTVPTPTPSNSPTNQPPGGSSSSGGSSGSPAQPPATTPAATPKSDNVSAQIEELKKLLQQNKTKEMGIETGVQNIVFELYPGENSQSYVHLKNTLNLSSQINATLSGQIRDFVTLNWYKTTLGRNYEIDLLVFAAIPENARSGNYFGSLTLENEVGKISIPITVRILEKKQERMLDLRVQPLVETLDPGETVRMEVNIFNLGDAQEIKGSLRLELVDPVTDNILDKTEPEEISLQSTYNGIKAIKIPRDIPNGRYVVRGIFDYTLGPPKQLSISAISYIRVQASVWSAKLFGTLSIWQLIPIIIILLAAILTYYMQYSTTKKKRRYVAKVDFTKLPEPGPRSGFLGLVAETKVRAFAAIDKLQMHTLIAGATGSGKTVAAQVIVEEALQKGTSVLVFDPTAQWTGFLRSQKNRDMLLNYKNFGMNADEAKAFKGNIYVVRDPNMAIDVKKYMKPGEITVFVMNKLSFADHETFIANTIKQVFAAGLPESPQLKLLLVYDEVHRLLTKFGGRGEGFIQIERGAREFRKWGVGMVLISQVLSDFVGEIKANIGTEIQMRTKYEGDLERLKLKYGEDSARSIVKESIGSGMVQNSEYNNGQPYFVSFRPLLHNVVRLSDTELSQYETYNDKVEKLEAEMEKLRQQGQDVLDLELEINLARDKVKKGAFNIVEIYLESLDQKIEAMKKKLARGGQAQKADVGDIGLGDLGLGLKPDKPPENTGGGQDIK